MADDDYSMDDEASDATDASAGDEKLFRRITKQFKQDWPAINRWRKEAKEDFAFYNGHQWSDEEKAKLGEQMRPALTFNRVAPLVNAVVGSEINNRREVRFIPREQGDAIPNELLTSAAEWFRDECGAEDEESESFSDCVVAGMGWTETRLDFDEEPDGAPKIERIDPFEMGWDGAATKANLADARRIWRMREMDCEEAEEMFPGVPRHMLHAAWAKTLSSQDTEPHNQDAADEYRGGQEEPDAPGRARVTVVEYQWIDTEDYYRAPDPKDTTKTREFTVEQFKILQRYIPEYPGLKQRRKVTKRVFVGGKILGKVERPLVPPGAFTYECITGYYDRKEESFYGVVRPTRDPQRWANKFFSQVMHILNSQAKGGIMAERGAFEDERQAEESWARTDAITYLTKNALSGPSPKIQPKPQAAFPAGFFQLLQESKEAISAVTGLSPEFLGTREADQPGVLEYQRRQSSLNLLAKLFNGLRRYRMRQGRTMLYLIQNHLADGRLVRIVGDDREQYVPLTKANIASVKYDIIVDDAPSSPNEKEKTWQIMQGIMPMVAEYLTPDIGVEILRFSPLPASMVEKLAKKIQEAQAQQQQQPDPEMQKAELEIGMKQADLQAKQQGHAMDLEAKRMEIALDMQKAQIDAYVAQQKLQNDREKLAVQAASNAVARDKVSAQRTAAATAD